MPKLVNRAKMTTATTGTGTITLGSAVNGYQTFANAGVTNGNIVRYAIEDGNAWEIGLGTYSSTGTTLTRGTIESSTGSAINLSGNATVFVTAAAGDLQELVTFAETFALPTADGTNGQVLTTNGAGALTFTSPGASLAGQTDSASPFETSLGVGAGAVNTGVNNTFVGFEVGNDNTTGTNNVAVGFQALDVNTTGSGNVGIGSAALGALTTGSNNVAIGNGALDAATTGGRNIAIGQDAMGLGVATAASGDNVAIGFQAGYDLTTGTNNIMIGYNAGANLTTSSDGVFIGRNAGASITAIGTADGTVIIGKDACQNATGGYRSVVIGGEAADIGTGNLEESVIIGYKAASAHTSNGFNTVVGSQALRDSTTGRFNAAFGTNAAQNTTTGQQNTVIGYNAANSGVNDLTTGSNNTIIGYNAAASSATVSNEITLGNSSITALRCQVTTITSLSDARDKTDIQPLNAGLEFVEALNPVSFTWNMRDGGKVGVADTGFIAQDLQMAQEWAGVTIPGLVYDVNPDKLEAGYGKLIPVLVQAIKDLSAKVNLLEAQLEAQK